MEAQEVTRLMAQFSAELRKCIKPTDRWTVESLDWPLDGTAEPRLIVLLRLRRTMSDDRVWQWLQVFEPAFLRDVPLDVIARYHAGRWEDEVARAIAAA